MVERLGILLPALVAVGGMGAPAGASATTLDCTFRAEVVMSPPLLPVGGASRYELTSAADASQCRMNGGALQSTTISSTGGFTNEICGTGRAFSSAGTHTTTIKLGATTVISSASYSIDFHGGQGLLKISAVNGSAEDSTSQTAGPRDPTDDTEIDGVATITPVPAMACVSQFELTGAFTLKW